MATHVAPAVQAAAYTCPHCDTLATQDWGGVHVSPSGFMTDMAAGQCSHCQRCTIWVRVGSNDWRMVFPDASPAPLSNEDLPDDIRADYEEAACILNRSPRGAAALLRLGIQKMCKHLGEPGKNINDDVAALVKKGLSPLIQQALDTVRITGNEAVHPGEINLNDDRELAFALFDFVNIIAEDRITTPRKVQEMYDRLPEAKRKAVEDRDS